MDLKILNFFQKHVKKNSTVVLGVSGGPDSIYLLHQCLDYQTKHPFKIIIAHLNHNLRKEESQRDAAFVKKIAKTYKLPYHQKKLAKLPKGNLEEICRIKRYEFLENVRKKTGAEWIVTAHHQNDNIETVLFNIARGSFLGGLKGMQVVSPERHLLRPLLSVPKKEILQYLKKNHLAFCIDSSNNNLRFSRNLIRKKIIPIFKKINPQFEETFSKNLINIQQAEQYLQKTVQQWLTKKRSTQGIPLRSFLKLEVILQKIALEKLYKEVYGVITKFNIHHLEEILKVLSSQKKGNKKEFGAHYNIVITFDGKEKFISLVKKK